MSNPTRVVNIKEYAIKLFGDYQDLPGRNPSAVFTTRRITFLAVAMTLLDNEVSFNAFKNQSLTDEIVSLTLAKRENIEAADFIFINELKYVGYAIENAKSGTLADPHKSATIIIQNDDEPSCCLTLSGPGIDGQIEIAATQTVRDAITMRATQNYEYPQGIDLIFVSGNGDLFAIPRLVKVVA